MTSYLSRLLSTQAIKRAPLHLPPKRTVFSFTEPRLDTIDVAELPPKDLVQFQNAYQHFISQYGQSRPNSDGVAVTEARLMTNSDLSHSLEEHVFQSDDATLNPLSTFMPGLPKIVIDELEYTKQTLLTLSNPGKVTAAICLCRQIIIPAGVHSFSSGLHTDPKVLHAANFSFYLKNTTLDASLYPPFGPGINSNGPHLLLSPQHPHNVITYPVDPTQKSIRYSLILGLL